MSVINSYLASCNCRCTNFQIESGIDFASGTRIDLQSKQAVTVSDVHKDFKELNIDVKEENIVPTGDDNKGFAVRTFRCSIKR